MATLTASYFTGELLIPAISGSTYAEVENLAALTAMITKYEPEFLELLLGEEMYEDYAAAIALNPTSGAWYELKAQIFQTSPYYRSPAANYVYYKFWMNYRTTTLISGEGKTNVENAENVSRSHKAIAAWNEMCDLADDVQEWIDDNLETYVAEFVEWGGEEHTTFERYNQWGI